ncbi:MAG: transcriptional regulator [Planctomycetales bacterium]
MNQKSDDVGEAQSLPEEFAKLAEAVASLPSRHRSRIEPLWTQVTEQAVNRRRNLRLVQDAISGMRLDLKYLMFDLEATRSERDAYRRRLDESERENDQGAM